MRLLHVATLVSPDGAFGGPVRVAENQVAALRARGHDVVLTAGQRGFADGLPTPVDGSRLFPALQLPGTGFSGLLAPAMLRWLRTALRGVDAVHVHLGRDLVTLPAAVLALQAGVPLVLQTHGMVVASRHPLAAPLDALLTRRALTGASSVLYLTQDERAGLQAVVRGAGLPLRALGNGVPVTERPAPLPARPEVLFCARLHRRKRPGMFVRMAERLLREGIDASFVLVGPDEGEGQEVQAAVGRVADASRLRWEGALPPSRTLERMQRSSLLVLPSVDEPYPMSVLEALSVGRPVVVTDSCGLAPSVQQSGCGTVVDESEDALVAAVGALLREPATLAAMAAACLPAVAEHFSMDAVADVLEDVYAAARTRPV